MNKQWYKTQSSIESISIFASYGLSSAVGELEKNICTEFDLCEQLFN